MSIWQHFANYSPRTTSGAQGMALWSIKEDRRKMKMKMWLTTLAYVLDVFSNLNELNLSLQDNCLTVFSTHEKIQRFDRKLVLWASCVKRRNFSQFTTLQSFLIENDLAIQKELCNNVCSHVDKLSGHNLKLASN